VRYLYLAIANLVFVLVIVLASRGQEKDNPRFWTKQNIAMVSAISATTATDAYFTERNWHHSINAHENNLLIPASQAGRVVYFAGTLAASLAVEYLLYRHHPRLATWAMRIHLGIETQAAAWSASHP
jgi:hypothetical protein